jgi:hypothetical protein
VTVIASTISIWRWAPPRGVGGRVDDGARLLEASGYDVAFTGDHFRPMFFDAVPALPAAALVTTRLLARRVYRLEVPRTPSPSMAITGAADQPPVQPH